MVNENRKEKDFGRGTMAKKQDLEKNIISLPLLN